MGDYEKEVENNEKEVENNEKELERIARKK